MNYLNGGPLPHCTGDDWKAVNELGFATVESGLTQQVVCLPLANRDRRIFAND